MSFLLYLFSILGSGAGFLTQILVSGFWTTAFSHDVYHYSINLSFYFLAMGLGSLVSTFIKRPRLNQLAYVALSLAFISGNSINFLKWGISRFGEPLWLPLSVVVLSGILSGIVIPLTLRIGKDLKSLSLSTLFFMDYAAAIVFTLLFTFLFLVPLGYTKTSLLVGVSLTVVLFLALVVKRQINVWLSLSVLVCLISPFSFSYVLRAQEAPRMDNSGSAKVLYSEQSHYQKIVLTEEHGIDQFLSAQTQHVLYLDGFIQFSSVDEQSYHICLANIPVAAVQFNGTTAKSALILGGGDGLVARNLLSYPQIEKITMVELDPAMIHLSKRNPVLRTYNLDSLKNLKVEVVIDDAFTWVQRAAKEGKTYDLIVVDFPAPKNLSLARLFSAEFYRIAFRLLSEKGIASIQAGPSYSFEDKNRETISKVTASIKRTLESIKYTAFPYVTPEDSEAFVLVTKNTDFNMVKFAQSVGMNDAKGVGSICRYDSEWKIPPVEVNSLNNLKIATYMLEWFRNAGQPFFFFRGSHRVFLPE